MHICSLSLLEKEEQTTLPKLFNIGSYIVYFWSNESNPLEPVHIHISKGRPNKNGTKIWITSEKKCVIANNNSHIPMHVLRDLIDIVQVYSDYIISQWEERFDTKAKFIK